MSEVTAMEVAILDHSFRRVGEAVIDERKRISLAKAVERLKQLLGDREVHFGIYVNDSGQLLLSPEVSVPVHELWLLKNPEAQAKLREGLKQAAEGDLHDLGSFAKFAEDEIE
jgi:hypothetical protein